MNKRENFYFHTFYSILFMRISLTELKLKLFIIAFKTQPSELERDGSPRSEESAGTLTVTNLI